MYVDKTDQIFRLADEGKYYFLSRPRRFGKSLLLSTLEAYFHGRKDLFKGLAIEHLEKEWTTRPVLYLDLNAEDYNSEEALHGKLNLALSQWERVYGSDPEEKSLATRFEGIIRRACMQSGQPVAVLVDEYDKPMHESVGNPSLQESYRKTLRSLYGALKSGDAYIHFALLTGVTKFSKVSIFSDLNNLRDISMLQDYSTLCGITEEELLSYFQPEIAVLADEEEFTVEECIKALKDRYDGYHFHPKAVGVYNPFSLLRAFFNKELGSYWFATGTPTFLMDKMKSARFDVHSLTDKTLSATESRLQNYRGEDSDPVPLLYQTGYLTLAGYDKKRNQYILTVPNKEVEYGDRKSVV